MYALRIPWTPCLRGCCEKAEAPKGPKDAAGAFKCYLCACFAEIGQATFKSADPNLKHAGVAGTSEAKLHVLLYSLLKTASPPKPVKHALQHGPARRGQRRHGRHGRHGLRHGRHAPHGRAGDAQDHGWVHNTARRTTHRAALRRRLAEETKPVNEIEALDAMILRRPAEEGQRPRQEAAYVAQGSRSRDGEEGRDGSGEETWLEYKFNQLLDAMPDAPVPYDPFAASMNAAMAGGAERDLGADDGTSTTSTKVVTPQGVTKPISPVKI